MKQRSWGSAFPVCICAPLPDSTGSLCPFEGVAGVNIIIAGDVRISKLSLIIHVAVLCEDLGVQISAGHCFPVRAGWGAAGCEVGTSHRTSAAIVSCSLLRPTNSNPLCSNLVLLSLLLSM